MNKNIPWSLIISHLNQELNQEDEDKLRKWLQIPKNTNLYKELETLWNEVRKDAVSYTPDTIYFWTQLETRINKKPKRVTFISIKKFKITIAAASILLILSIFSSYYIGITRNEQDTHEQFYTALNGKSEIVLPDGSLVCLNIGSKLSFNTSFTKKREIKLDGEALFDVKKDTERPFIVSIGDVSIKVHGTRFNVNAYPINTQIRVALLEGKVSLSTIDKELIMKPGEIVSFNKGSKEFTLEPNKDLSFESFWAEHHCSFEAKPLGYICKYLERWYNVDIEVDETIAASHVYTFTIIDEPLETVLQIMSRINPIKYSFEENKRVRITKVKTKKK